MTLRAAVPALVLLSVLTGLPAAHAAGCANPVTDVAGDAPTRPLDVLGADVAVGATDAVVTLHVGTTSWDGDPFRIVGASVWVQFAADGAETTVWRHVSSTEPDVYGGTGLGLVAHSLTADTVTWTFDKTLAPNLAGASTICVTAWSSIQPGSHIVDSTSS